MNAYRTMLYTITVQQRVEIAQISAGLCCRTRFPDHPFMD